MEIDVDLDGRFDRWEDFDYDQSLVRFALLGEGYEPGIRYHPKVWTVVGSDGAHKRYEHDSDGDGRCERIELVENGRVARVEPDTDRDGKLDRWQDWTTGRLGSESVDVDKDGQADLRLRFGKRGEVARVERVSK
jgi:hypothetical protein